MTARLTAEAISFTLRNEAAPDTDEWRAGEAEIPRIVAFVNDYLRIFASVRAVETSGTIVDAFRGSYCICGRQLGGLLGSFAYGIAHGEGYCAGCNWPARANHYIKDPEIGEVVLTITAPYPYHPYYVQSVEARAS